MVIELTSSQAELLEKLAADAKISAEEAARIALESYLRHIEDLRVAVHEGEESAEREGWLSHDEVFSRLAVRLQSNA